jgi:hypothetical protein
VSRPKPLAPKRRGRPKAGVQERLSLPLGEGSEQPPQVLSAEQIAFLEQLDSFGVSEGEARRLVTEKLEACRLKVPAIPYLPKTQGKSSRGGNVRSFIERDDWELPEEFKAAKAKAEKDRKTAERRQEIAACALCDEKGHRFVVTPDHPRGAVRFCSHNSEKE